jgi:hypothetical protein
VYQEVTSHYFVNLDDGYYVEHNEQVRSGLSLRNLWWALTTTDAGNWHPLTWISLQLDASLQGTESAGFHRTNLVLHIANTVLLFFVLRRMTEAPWRSAIVAALFGLHPLHVESVAWVAERKDVLSALFWILTMGAYARFVEERQVGGYLVVVFSFALGLMAKPMLVTLPCVLLLLHYWPLSQKSGQESFSQRADDSGVATEKSAELKPPAPFSAYVFLPLFALSAASAVVTIYAQSGGGAVQSTTDFPLLGRFGDAASAYVGYIGKLFVPVNLSAFYAHERNPNVLWQVSAALIIISISLFVLRRRTERYLFVGWFWYLGTLVPVIGFVQVGLQAMADRYTYIPSIGIFIVLVWSLADLFTVLSVPRWVPAGGAAAVLVFCGFTTYVQVGHWRNSITLWEQAVRVEPNSSFAHRSLGTALLADRSPGPAARRHERREKALAEYKIAVECDPNDADAHFSLGVMLAETRRLPEAVDEYLKAIGLRPDVAEWHHNLGIVLRKLGREEEAAARFRKADRLMRKSRK